MNKLYAVWQWDRKLTDGMPHREARALAKRWREMCGNVELEVLAE